MSSEFNSPTTNCTQRDDTIDMYETAGSTNYLITFAIKWRHWGGGSGEDILVEFGLSQREYFTELRSLLDNNVGMAAELAPALRGELTRICNDRLRTRHLTRR